VERHPGARRRRSVFGVTVRADLFGAPIPDWYLPISGWVDGR